MTNMSRLTPMLSIYRDDETVDASLNCNWWVFATFDTYFEHADSQQMLNIGVKRDKQLVCALYCSNTASICGHFMFENIGNIGISAIINIGVSAYRQKTNIGTPLL